MYTILYTINEGNVKNKNRNTLIRMQLNMWGHSGSIAGSLVVCKRPAPKLASWRTIDAG